METANVKISGMTCGGCVNSVSRVLNALDGVVKAEVSLDPQRAVVEYDAAKLNLEQIKHAVTDAGYEVAA